MGDAMNRRGSVTRAIALALSMVLTVTLLETVPSPVAAAPKDKSKPVRELGLLNGGQRPVPKTSGKTDADFAPLAKRRTGSSYDPQHSKLVSRTMFTEEYLNPDGTRTMRQSTAPLNVKDAAGRWRKVDTSLSPAQGRLGADAHPLSPSLSTDAADPSLVEVEAAGKKVRLAMDSAGRKPAKVSGRNRDKVTYAGVQTGTDLEYQVTGGSLKESIVLRTRPAKGTNTWRFKLDTGGLTPTIAKGGGVELRDAARKLVMSMPPIETWDSTGTDDRPPAMTGGTYTLAKRGKDWTLTVRVDEKWLQAAERKYPVYVDPTLTYGVVESYDYRSDGYECHNCGLRVGNSLNNGDSYNRAVFHVNYDSMMGKNVVGARMDVWRPGGIVGSIKSHPAHMYHASAFNFNGVGGYMASAVVGDVGSFSGDGLTGFLRHLVQVGHTGAWFMLIGDEKAGAWTYKNLDATLLVDYGNAPPAANLVAPLDNTVMTSTTPTLSVSPVTDPDGEAVKYCFRVATGADANSGIVVESGCLPNPTWTVPERVLRDGVAYTWHAWTTSNLTTTKPSWIGHFKVDQRIGEHGPAPTDSVGGIEVNLANGNISVGAGSPTFDTVGGSAGVSFDYNSQAASPRGLTAEYFNDVNHNGSIDDNVQPSLVRLEPSVNIDYGMESPLAPALPVDWWAARWTGYFQAPETGTYQFSGVNDDALNVWANGQHVYKSSGVSNVNWTAEQAIGSVALNKGQRIPIKVELGEATWTAFVRLFVRTTDEAIVKPQLVRPEWLFTEDVPALSEGWSLSADLDGGGTGYVSSQVADQTIVLTDASGAKHTWTKKTTGGYTPPADEDGVLALDAAGRVTLHDGDVIYVFTADGKLETQTSALDDRKPAALKYGYDGSPRRLREIKDPVGGRAMRLHYARGGDDCYTGLTRPEGADPAPPAQMLCRIVYWDGTQTVLWYHRGNLARIEDPGAELTDFGYTSDGLLNQLRDPLINDWIAVDYAARFPDATAMTSVVYTDHEGRKKPASITQPAPAPGQPRPGHGYRYVSKNETQVDVAGVSPPIGY